MEGQSQCFGIHFSPEDPLVVVDVGYGAGGRDTDTAEGEADRGHLK